MRFEGPRRSACVRLPTAVEASCFLACFAALLKLFSHMVCMVLQRDQGSTIIIKIALLQRIKFTIMSAEN